jgi:hypothetical protein
MDRYHLAHAIGFDVLPQNTTDEWLRLKRMNMAARANQFCEKHRHLSKIGPDVKNHCTGPNVMLRLAHYWRVEDPSRFQSLGYYVARSFGKPPPTGCGFKQLQIFVPDRRPCPQTNRASSVGGLLHKNLSHLLAAILNRTGLAARFAAFVVLTHNEAAIWRVVCVSAPPPIQCYEALKMKVTAMHRANLTHHQTEGEWPDISNSRSNHCLEKHNNSTTSTSPISDRTS